MSWRKWVIAFDVHGNEQDKSAVKAFFKFCDLWKPDERILGGDLWNLAALRKNASAEEKRESLQEDYAKGCEFRDRFKPTKFVLGNHDSRCYEWRNAECGPISDLCGAWCKEMEASLALHNCIWRHYGKREYLPIGDTNTFVAHGTAHGTAAARNMAIGFASIGNVKFGHGHQIQTHTLATLNPRTAEMGGCLCKTEQPYNATHMGTLAQENGWPYGVWNTKTREVISWQARRTSTGRFILPSDIQTL